MPKFKKKTKSKPEIPTSALPDIIFILLFFFMVATKPRPAEAKVEVESPFATQIQVIPEDMESVDIHIGIPKDATYGTEPVLHSEDRFPLPVKEIPQFISAQVQKKLPEKKRAPNLYPNYLIVNLKIDNEVDYGLIDDVEQELRRIGIRHINYDSKKTIEE